jgi:hypothetical protein
MSLTSKHEARVPRTLDAMTNTEPATQAQLHGAMSETEPRSGLQKILSTIARGPSVVMRRLSCRDLFASSESISGALTQELPTSTPEEPEKAEKRPLMAEILLYPLEVTVYMLSALRKTLGTTTSVIYIERPESPTTMAHGLVHDFTGSASVLKPIGVAELSSPKDEGSAVLALALERLAAEVRRDRQEAREDAQKQEDERHRKLAQARDAIHHIDMLNGIRNPAAEDIIRQMEGPYGISVEAAMARMEDINRSEKK